jgi:hypothetical protein
MIQRRVPSYNIMDKALQKKKKMKKNANDFVDFEIEKKLDPKYKTELCKSYSEKGFCIYGNQCRFAHGYHQLQGRVNEERYKKKNCVSFKELGFCMYGLRCNFIHDERRIDTLERTYYKLLIESLSNDITYSYNCMQENFPDYKKTPTTVKRLTAFESIKVENQTPINNTKDEYLKFNFFFPQTMTHLLQ